MAEPTTLSPAVSETASTPSTESASTPETQGADLGTTATTTEGSSEATTQKTYSSWEDALADADRDALLRHPKLSGLVGDAADRLEKRRAAERAQAEEQARLRKAVEDDDLVTLGEAKKKELLPQIEQEPFQTAGQTIAKSVQTGLGKWLSEKAPGASVDGSKHDGKPFDEGIVGWVDDAAEAIVQHRLSKAVEAEIAKRMPAIKKQILAEANGEEPSPEVGSGSAARANTNTDKQFLIEYSEGRSNDHARWQRLKPHL